MDAVPAQADRASGISAIALGFCAAALLAIAGSVLSDGDLVPVGLLVGAGLLPLVLFASVQTLVWDHRYAFAAGILVIVFQTATLRTRDIDDKSVDFQILIKLGCLSIMAAVTLSAVLLRRPAFAARGLPLWIAFLVYAILNSSHAVQPGLSLVETASNLIGFTFAYAFLERFGPSRLVDALIVSCFILCCVSILAYFGNPQLGRMSDWTNGLFVPTGRLQGVLGTANAAGAAAGFGVLLMCLASRISARRPLFHVLILPMVFCLLASNNRMSLLAVLICLSYVYLVRGNTILKLTVAAIGIGLFTLVMVGFGDQILASVARSGSTEEITSGTGRSRVWAVVIDLWSQQPLFGYGDGSAKFILPVHPMLFKAAAHAHNVYLNVLFAGGAVGLLIFLTALFVTLRRAVQARAHVLIALALFYLIYGITEPVIGGLFSFITLGFYAIVGLVARSPQDYRERRVWRDHTPFRLNVGRPFAGPTRAA